jgi:hypothetical protein
MILIITTFPVRPQSRGRHYVETHHLRDKHPLKKQSLRDRKPKKPSLTWQAFVCHVSGGRDEGGSKSLPLNVNTPFRSCFTKLAKSVTLIEQPYAEIGRGLRATPFTDKISENRYSKTLRLFLFFENNRTHPRSQSV